MTEPAANNLSPRAQQALHHLTNAMSSGDVFYRLVLP